jgi:hypothetical protein
MVRFKSYQGLDQMKCNFTTVSRIIAVFFFRVTDDNRNGPF